MLSFKRLLYIILVVAVLGGIFLINNIHESQPASVQLQSGLVPEREFTETVQVDEGKKPSVWILGNLWKCQAALRGPPSIGGQE